MDTAPAARQEESAHPVLVERVSATGLVAVTDAYDRFAAGLYSYVASLTRGGDAAEDIVQEGFMRLVGELRAGRPPDDLRPWLYAVCTNLVASRARRRSIAERWRHVLRPRDDELRDEAAEDTVIRREQNGDMRRALEALPREHRAALLLAADGFSGREIARVLGRSEGATRNILWRSRLALRDRLDDGGAR